MGLWLAGQGLPLAWGADATSTDPVTVDKKADNLHFQLPPDWPVEKRGGIMAPIPIEEYLARKFKAIETQLQFLEQRFNGFDIRLRVIEEAQKNSSKGGLRSTEQAAPSKPAEK